MGEIRVAGVDGAPGGWVVVVAPAERLCDAVVSTARDFAQVLEITAACVKVAIDIPIGLPETSGIGGRLADVEARANLGARQSSVFAVPSRRAVMETDYAKSCAAALATSDPPRKVSKQAFNLFPKIREVDGLMTPPLQDRVVECHPELAFWALADEQPLTLPKKIKSRPFAEGLALRVGLLATAGFGREALTNAALLKPVRAGPDDLIDAAACCWSASRIARGGGRRFPAGPPVDIRGLRMEIWC
jgi:predicted RNase H-like nuclease